MIGDTIRRARLAEGLTQYQLAKRVDVSQVSISAWESERKLPSRPHVCSLERVLNLTPGFLEEECEDFRPSRHPGDGSPRYLDAAPLIGFVEHRIPTHPRGASGLFDSNDNRIWFRLKKTGRVGYAMADRLCCHLGVHPTQVFGSEWA